MIDYKFVFILLIIVLCIFLIFRELIDFKESIKKHENIVKNMEANIQLKINNGIDSCVQRVKYLNSELVVQIRRMNDIGRDAILIDSNNNNNFTDLDSAANIRSDIQIQHIKKPSEYFNVRVKETSEINNEKNENESEIKVINEKKDNLSENSGKKKSDKKEKEKYSENIDDETEQETEEETNDETDKTPDVEEKEKDKDKLDIVITLKTLKSESEYTKKELENIAKTLSISSLYKDGTRHKVLNKGDLYIKIKEKLENQI